MVVQTLSLVQKYQTNGSSGCSGIVVYGGGNIVFCVKKVKPIDAVEEQYMVVGTLSLVQNGQTSGHSGCSGIVVYGEGASSSVQKG